MAYRKLQMEIEKILKKVDEGVLVFEQIWDKVYSATTSSQKEKYEGDLKTQIKRLQRFRDSIKTWQGDSSIKDKSKLDSARKLIEEKMEKFKICEKETKTKAFSKEGLALDRTDPKERAKREVGDWIADAISRLRDQCDEFEAEIESLSGTGKKKKGNQSSGRIDDLRDHTERHQFHIAMLERILRAVDNETVSCDEANDLKESIDYYIDANQEADFYEDEGMYDALDLEATVPATLKDGETEAKEAERKPGDAEEPATSPTRQGRVPGAGSAGAAPTTPLKGGSASSPPRTSSGPQSAPSASALRSPPTTSKGMASTSPPPRADGQLLPAPLAKSSGAPASIAPVPSAAGGGGGARGPLLSNIVRGTTATGSKGGASASEAGATPQKNPGALPLDAQGELPPKSGPSSDKAESMLAAGMSRTSLNAGPMSLDVAARHASWSLPGHPELSDLDAGQQPPLAPTGGQVQPFATHSFSRLGGPGSGQDDRKASASELMSGRQGRVAPPVPPTSVSSEDVSRQLLVLERASKYLPESVETESNKSATRSYKPRNPTPVPPSFPTAPTAAFDNPALFQQFDVDTLFFIFYYQQGTYQQYLAARELKRQAWRFHKKFCRWFQRHEEPKITTDEYEQGTYLYFDYVLTEDYETGWCQRIKTDFTFEYLYLEDELQ